MDQLFDDVRILDLSEGIPGPFASRIFADYGADVIKVEAPAGDPARRHGPFPGDRPDPEASALFLHLNRNKRGITLDITSASGAELLRKLVKSADIVVESFAPGHLAACGLGFETLREIKPDLVLASLTPFGQDGPYAGYQGNDIIYYALGGMNMTGDAELYPIKKAASMVEHQVGNNLALAMAAGFMAARYQGRGQHIDLAAAEVQQTSVDRRAQLLLGHAYSGESSSRESLSAGALPSGIFPCRDGYVQVMTTPAWAERMARTLNRPDFMKRLAEPGALYSMEFKAEIDAVFQPWLAAHTRHELFQQALANQWPVYPINTIKDLMEDAHFRSREFWIEQEHPVVGPLTYPGPLARMESGFVLRWPSPRLGEHNQAIYGTELGLSGAELSRLKAAGVI